MKKLYIDVLANDGSPLGVTLPDVYGKNGRLGVGGAELALLTMCEAWHVAGHRVRLYNSPTHMGLSPFEQYPVDTFFPNDERDILIVFRSPNHRILHARGMKIWWSTDQFTVGDFQAFQSKVDKIVTISPFHANYFQETYGIVDTNVIDLPVRMEDYDHKIEKVEHRMIFCSVPDRGLDILASAYPEIKKQVQDASLVITSDYRLWGVQEARNEQFIQRFLGMDGVRFLGAVPRMDMVEEQLKAEVMAYPCTYPELFCYAVAECQVAGAYPVTTSMGALITTNMG
jgi:glycosyltransferase involved in cell wall biosynthesis